jgi:glycosyltransferase involved in cell wall biosynthesis
LRTLFLTWDGAQQTYLESLFFPIFAELGKLGVEVDVLQLTWADPAAVAANERAARRFGLHYRAERTSRRFGLLGQLSGVARGARLAVQHMRERSIDVLFPRSLLPASMALLALQHRRGSRLVFDADGLMADERVDFAGWSPRSPMYRTLRLIEARTLRRADSVITRTEAAKSTLVERGGADVAPKIFVIPNAKDPAVFAPGTAGQRAEQRQRLGIPQHAPLVVYTGSLGPQYVPERMLDLLMELRRRNPDTRFVAFTFQERQLESALRARGFPAAHSLITRAEPDEIPAALAAADLGLALRKVSFSQRAICPIKVAEYLQCGVPVVSSPVGDLAEQLDGRVAFLIDPARDQDLRPVSDWFFERVLPERDGVRRDCRAVGERLFGVHACAKAYRAAFARVVVDSPSGVSR